MVEVNQVKLRKGQQLFRVCSVLALIYIVKLSVTTESSEKSWMIQVNSLVKKNESTINWTTNTYTSISGQMYASDNVTNQGDNKSNNNSVLPGASEMIRNGNVTALVRNNNMTLSPTIQSMLPISSMVSQNQIIKTDPKHPLFFKDGLQKTCSNNAKQNQYPTTMEGSFRPSNHTFTCLTVSANGVSATFTTLILSSLSDLIVNGDAVLFGADIEQYLLNTSWLFGRTMNRLVQVRNAMSYSAFCGKLVILPIAISLDPEGQGEFDCADFRLMGRRDTMRAIDKLPRVVQQQKTAAANFCSSVIPEGQEWFRYVLPRNLRLLPDGGFKNRANAAFKTFWAWWGLGPGYFRCQACTENDLDQTIAWARSNDVYHREIPHPGYGQPPIDFYIKSIKLSGGRHIRLLSLDGDHNTTRILTSPIVTELPNHDFGGDNETSPINVKLVLGEPFYKVLHQLFCAKAAVIGESSLARVLLFSPNAEKIFLPRPRRDPEVIEYGTTDVYYYDIGMNNYSVYQHWSNSAEQRLEMLTFQKGTIKSIVVRNRTM